MDTALEGRTAGRFPGARIRVVSILILMDTALEGRQPLKGTRNIPGFNPHSNGYCSGSRIHSGTKRRKPTFQSSF